MNYLILCLIICILTLTIYFILLYLSNKLIVETFDTKLNVEYLDKKDGERIFKNSNYISSLDNKDLEVRKCSSVDECINNYTDSVINFTPNEKLFLEKIISTVNNKTKKYTSFNNLSWRFIKLKDNIENRFPFTLENVIFLNEIFFTKSTTQDDVIQTIFHEQLHIYQRLYVEKSKEFYKAFDFDLIKCDCIDKLNERSNPDLYKNTHYIYKGFLVRNQYLLSAKTLSDTEIIFDKINNADNYNGKEVLNTLKSTYNINIEHPNEIFATIIPLKVLHNIKFDNNFKNFEKELNKYLS